MILVSEGGYKWQISGKYIFTEMLYVSKSKTTHLFKNLQSSIKNLLSIFIWRDIVANTHDVRFKYRNEHSFWILF